jgi:MFS transporter, DHA1 family, inner membrane transport protein
MERREHDGGLAALTSAKWASNAAYRWIPPFLPDLERAFGTSTATMTTVLGLGELAGLTTVLIGGPLDRGHERRILLGGMVLTGVSCLVAMSGSVAMFAVAYVLLVIGVSAVTVSGHAWIAARTPFHERGRSIGLFETSWALALLLGAPLAGVLITAFGWRAPLVAWIVALVVTGMIVQRTVQRGGAPQSWRAPAPSGDEHARTSTTTTTKLPASAWRIILGSAFVACAGMAVVVVSGAWLSDRYGMNAAGIGAVAIAFGVLELIASLGTARLTDRLGKPKAVAFGLAVVGVALGTLVFAGPSVALGVTGLTLFLGGFEFAFVSSLSLVTEAAPQARGKAVGMGNAVATITRSAGAVASGLLYDRFGMGGSVALAAAAVAAAGVLLVRRVSDRLQQPAAAPA